MDPALTMAQLPNNLVTTEAPGSSMSDPMSGNRIDELGAKFQSLMSRAQGSGVPTAPEDVSTIEHSSIGQVIEAQDADLNGLMTEMQQEPANRATMSIDELVAHESRVNLDMQMALFRLQLGMTAVHNARSGVEELMKNQ